MNERRPGGQASSRCHKRCILAQLMGECWGGGRPSSFVTAWAPRESFAFCPSLLFFHLPLLAVPAVPSPRLPTSVYPNVSVSLDTRVCRAVFHFMDARASFVSQHVSPAPPCRLAAGPWEEALVPISPESMTLCLSVVFLGLDLGSCRRWCCHLCLHLNPIVTRDPNSSFLTCLHHSVIWQSVDSPSARLWRLRSMHFAYLPLSVEGLLQLSPVQFLGTVFFCKA